jgi:4-amino-4-deoxy-L-arabinose transferase-like glycosyltransferase
VVALGSIVLLAFAVRLAWTLWTAPEPPFLSDPEYYNATALSLARDLRYAVVFDDDLGFLPGGDPTAFWPPGYPAFLAVAYRAFGESLHVGRTANVLVGTLTVAPIYLVGRVLFGRQVAWLGAGVSTVFPSLVFWTPVLFSDTLFTFLFACATALLLHSTREDTSLRPRMILLFGITLGFGVLVRGQALVLLPLALAWWLLNGVPWRAVVVPLVGALAIAVALLVPWSVRNAAVMDSPILVSANFGYNLRIGHAPYATGRYVVPPDLWDAEPGISFQKREVLFNDLGAERALDFALGTPGDEFRLSGRKIMWLWRPDSDALHWVTDFGASPLPGKAWEPLRVLLDASYLSVLALAGAALFVRRLRRQTAFIATAVVLWTVGHVVFFGESRYHLPLLALIVPLASASALTFTLELARRAPLRPPLRLRLTG